MSANDNTVVVTQELLRSYVDNCRRDKYRRIFSVLFTKKDGSKRRMVIKPGIRSKGGFRAWIPENFGKRFVFDVQKNGWRTLDLGTVEELRVCGIRYTGGDQ